MTAALTPGDAARVLGVSERLVRRLVAQGKLEATATDPLRVSVDSVEAERKRRAGKTRATRDTVAAMPLTAEQLETLVRSAVAAAMTETLRPQLESREAIERHLAAELARITQERDALAAELARKRRPWPRRG